MKRIFSILVLIIFIIGLPGCSDKKEAQTEVQVESYTSTQVSEINKKNDKKASNEQKYDINTPLNRGKYDYPQIVNTYNGFVNAIQKNELPFVLSDIWGQGDDETGGKWEFVFSLEYDDIIESPSMSITIPANDNKLHSGFEVYLNPECEQDILKEAVICSILAVDSDLTYEDSENLMNEMVEGFTGDSRSKIIDVNNYKMHISEGVKEEGENFYRGYPILHVVAYDDIHPRNLENFKSYSETSKYGEYVSIKGTVSNIVHTDYSQILEISTDYGLCGVFYSEDYFAGCFTIGDTYNFYGQVAKSRDSYNLCMKLDSFQIIEE